MTLPRSDIHDATRRQHHARCVVCGCCGPASLCLDVQVRSDGSVEGRFDCDERFAGYDGMLHGGVISALLDGAMTNCLFALGLAGVTAELNVRFRHPVEIGRPASVAARIVRRSDPLFALEADLTQDGECKATATGKFMQTPEGTSA